MSVIRTEWTVFLWRMSNNPILAQETSVEIAHSVVTSIAFTVIDYACVHAYFINFVGTVFFLALLRLYYYKQRKQGLFTTRLNVVIA